MIEKAFFRDRSKRIAKIAASAASHLEEGEKIRTLFQVQSGQAAEFNRWAVINAYEHAEVDHRTLHEVQSFAVLGTDRNVYVVTLTGLRLLDVGNVAYKERLEEAQIVVEDKHITVNEVVLHLMNHWEAQFEEFRELLESAKAPGA